MRHTLSSILFAGGFVACAGLALQASEAVLIPEPPAAIGVRTYTQLQAATAIRTARRVAGGILGRADIEIAWMECGPAAPVDEAEAAACARPLAANELVVRIVPAGANDAQPGADALGFAFVDVGAGGGWLATVYADRVSRLAQAAGVDAAELLGRAMAHEIGHLLLGTRQHGRHGLMRASWSGADLRRNRSIEWAFDGKEGATMRRRLAGRPIRPGAD